jgi:hypothetical protein
VSTRFGHAFAQTDPALTVNTTHMPHAITQQASILIEHIQTRYPQEPSLGTAGTVGLGGWGQRMLGTTNLRPK